MTGHVPESAWSKTIWKEHDWRVANHASSSSLAGEFFLFLSLRCKVWVRSSAWGALEAKVLRG